VSLVWITTFSSKQLSTSTNAVNLLVMETHCLQAIWFP
jgi:hypothetical protein